jgi:hypothetical protein
MTKHTPGPWIIDPDATMPLAVIRKSEDESVDGNGICELGDSTAESVANAHLICASPDMLSLLKQLRRAYSDSIDTKLAAIWDGVISKAEGAK